jgi:polyhydroxyalkanoate synthesis regulator phasin
MTEPTQAITDYFAALERLQAGRPVRVSKGTRITNDAVALEAGRGKGTIKKSRPVFAALIEAIDVAADAQANASPEQLKNAQLQRVKGTANQQRLELDAALGSLVARYAEVHELKKRVASLEAEVHLLKEKLAKASSGKVVKLKVAPD